MSFDQKMAEILPIANVGIDSGFFRNDDGSVHGAIDFNYTNSDLNVFGGPYVFAPVDGILVAIDQIQWGAVVIKRQDETYHRILHLHQIDASLGESQRSQNTFLTLT